MGITNQEYFLLFLASFIFVGFLTPIMRKIAVIKNILDVPNSPHKSHQDSIPYLGGVAIIIGIVTISYGTSLVSDFTVRAFWLATSILIPAIILGIVGLIDDIRKLSPWPRFVAQSIAALFTAILLIATDNVGNPTGSRLFDVVITVVWIVGVTNSINFFDNIDGGAAGTVAIIAFGLLIISTNSKQYLISSMSVITLGAMLGFLVWNRAPARIFMGDAGSLFLGTLISVLCIRIKPTTNTHIGSLVTPILLFAIPIMDTSVAVLSRLKRNISPFQGGKDHLSHRLMHYGLKRTTTVFTLWFLSMAFSVFSICLNLNFLSNYFWIFLGFIIWVGIFYFMKNVLD